MSGFDVHPDEMPALPPLDDAALEAWLSGRNGAADSIEPLALFAEDLGMAMGGPAPSPKSDLALLLAEGFSTDPATTQTAARPQRRRERMLVSELLAGLAAKLAGLGLAAKVGLGLGVAAASVGGAGAAGVLPDPVKDVVSTAVSAVTPLDLTDDGSGDDTDEGTDDGSGQATNTKNDFGEAVSADARGESDGVKGVDGQVISELARNKNNDKPNNGKNTTDSTTATTTGATAGATGLDKTKETPAAGHAPTSLPGPAAGTTGLDRANQTPAAGNPPSSVPVGGSGRQGPPASTGRP